LALGLQISLVKACPVSEWDGCEIENRTREDAMLAQSEIREPIFELKGGALGRIDLSAWLAGLSWATGLALAASPSMAAQILSGGPSLYILAGSMAVFLLTVLLIQRHMRLALTANTFGEPAHLTTTGIFRYSRNPIYVAFFIPLASISVFSLAAAIASMAIYVHAMNLTVIRKEERELLATFGEEYAQYLKTAPRWLI
jgi:protein-S-isoprenylcysteine O-methyltransferase Ste14